MKAVIVVSTITALGTRTQMQLGEQIDFDAVKKALTENGRSFVSIFETNTGEIAKITNTSQWNIRSGVVGPGIVDKINNLANQGTAPSDKAAVLALVSETANALKKLAGAYVDLAKKVEKGEIKYTTGNFNETIHSIAVQYESLQKAIVALGQKIDLNSFNVAVTEPLKELEELKKLTAKSNGASTNSKKSNWWIWLLAAVLGGCAVGAVVFFFRKN